MPTSRKVPRQAKPSAKVTPKLVTPELPSLFFMVALLATYKRSDVIKQRHMNVMLELDDPNITKRQLTQVHQSTMTRLKAENDVTPDQVVDIVFLSINLLGQMTRAEFYDTGGKLDDTGRPQA